MGEGSLERCVSNYIIRFMQLTNTSKEKNVFCIFHSFISIHFVRFNIQKLNAYNLTREEKFNAEFNKVLVLYFCMFLINSTELIY